MDTMELQSSEPNCGRRLLTRTVEEIASSTPDKVYATISLSDQSPYQFRDIKFVEVARCIDFLTEWLGERIDRSDCCDTLAFMGISDLRGVVLFHAAVKLGYKVLLLSHRNPPSTNFSLIERTECTRLCSVEELEPVVGGLKSLSADRVLYITIPSLETMLTANANHFDIEDTFETSENTPVVIFHSSGSTGPPKPIQMTNGTFATIDNNRRLARIDGRKKIDFTIWDFDQPSKFYFSFPPFHLAGFLASVVFPVFSHTAIPILGPPLKPPSGFIAREIIILQPVKALFVSPVIVEQLLDEPQNIDLFKEMDFVCFAGGPLSESAGNKLKGFVDLCQFFGTTETANIQHLLPEDNDDWSYVEWHPACNIEMQLSDPGEGTYELVQFLDASTRGQSPLNHNFPGIREWRSKDLFKPHPTNHKLWRFYGRLDDIIVLSNGHKFYPVTAEAIIQEHPEISAAIIIGQGKPQGALLLELGESKNKASVDSIWPAIEEANSRLPAPGRISRSMILIAPSDKRFVRTAKGTTVRNSTEKEFAADIDRLYEEGNETTQAQVPSWQSFEMEGLTRLLHTLVSQSLLGAQISEHDDFFIHGLDSLKTFELIKAIRVSFRQRLNSRHISKLSSRFIYENPTIEKLARAMSGILSQSNTNSAEEMTNGSPLDRIAAMVNMVEKYTHGLDRPEKEIEVAKQKTGLQVALTGSTGSLGSHLLRKLVKDPSIRKIWCLNRSENAEHKNKLDSDPNESRVTYLKIDFGQPNFGLEEDKMSELIMSVDVIVHNAWKVNFNQTLASFEPLVHGTRTIIDWSTKSPKRPRIFFISSVSSVANWAQVHDQELVPEVPLQDHQIAGTMGYGESKNVAETILAIASERTGTPISILRVGQIAGSTVPEDAGWPEQEWFPSLVRTSEKLRTIPQGLSNIDWIPIDKLVDIINEVMHYDSHYDDTRIYNIVNPQTIPWNSILETLRTHCGGESQIVSLPTWLDILEKKSQDIPDKNVLTEYPALKVSQVLGEMMDAHTAAKFNTDEGVAASQTMRELGPINLSLLQDWLRKLKV